MVRQSLIDILHAIAPFLAVGAVGFPILFGSVRWARWRTRRSAHKAGMTVVDHQPIVTDPHVLVLTPTDRVQYLPRPVRSHRRP